MQNYQEKLPDHLKKTDISSLPMTEQKFLIDKAHVFRFSYQELKQLVEMAIDFRMWNEDSLSELWQEFPNRKMAFNTIRDHWNHLKQTPNSYSSFDLKSYKTDHKFTFVESSKESLGIGMCPVASPKTRCCNLMTLDVVESCGFDCSYCSIQSFYNHNQIGIDTDLAAKLEALELDPDKTYHIGTGQSSDSLLWGNRGGILEALFTFAVKNPNVILEFKTKSDNVSYFLENDVPKNIICTWSLNTPTIIENEEHLTASLGERIESARKVADRGVKVGFHFHPIVEYENYLDEYGAVFKQLLNTFDPEEVVLVSLGTLTFIKPVIKQLRGRDFKSKILQMPLIDAGGKQSYPLETKRTMFRHAYESLQPWHDKVFFYLCMEDHSLWKDVFGYEFATNEDFERAMVSSYANKIGIEYIY